MNSLTCNNLVTKTGNNWGYDVRKVAVVEVTERNIINVKQNESGYSRINKKNYVHVSSPKLVMISFLLTIKMASYTYG